MRKELVGWKEIADRLGVTVRAAQRYAALERDPLPCYRRLRTVCLELGELEAWLDRHREPLAEGAPETMVLIPADPRLVPLVRLFHRAALRALERVGAPATPDARQVTVDEYLAGAPAPTEGDGSRGRR